MSSRTTENTPYFYALPHRCSDQFDIWRDNTCIAISQTESDALFIVRACSAHSELVAACHFVMKYHEMHLDRADDSELPFQLSDAVQRALTKATRPI
mgnify:CR=1 FL=1